MSLEEASLLDTCENVHWKYSSEMCCMPKSSQSSLIFTIIYDVILLNKMLCVYLKVHSFPHSYKNICSRQQKAGMWSN